MMRPRTRWDIPPIPVASLEKTSDKDRFADLPLGSTRRSGPQVMTSRGRSVLSSNVAVWILAILATMWFLRGARGLLIPLALGVLISYALEPIVIWLERRGIKRLFGAALVMAVILATGAAGAYTLRQDAAHLMRTLPDRLDRARDTVLSQIGVGSITLRGTGDDLTTAGKPASDSDRGAAGETDRGEHASLLKIDVRSLFALGGHLVVVFFLVFFLLISTPQFRKRLFEVAGPDAEQRRTTAVIIDDINTQIQRYLLVLLVTAIMVGTATWLMLAWQKVQHAAIWGMLAGVFNSIPYFGPVIVSGGLLVVGLAQGGGIEQALRIAGAALLITSIEGWLVTPALMGKAERMSALVVFVGLVLWTWLWGEWGTILAVPMLVVIKSVADHVDGLKKFGRLMSP
jgi:predicted PurR-regulated permease PerM